MQGEHPAGAVGEQGLGRHGRGRHMPSRQEKHTVQGAGRRGTVWAGGVGTEGVRATDFLQVFRS